MPKNDLLGVRILENVIFGIWYSRELQIVRIPNSMSKYKGYPPFAPRGRHTQPPQAHDSHVDDKHTRGERSSSSSLVVVLILGFTVDFGQFTVNMRLNFQI